MLKQAVNVLLEGKPADVNIAELRECLPKIKSAVYFHDLDFCSLTSGCPSA
ncbi:MAG: hypothetical protein H7Z37_12995 [Pyrinomonadaceae bacterium]|nr:hypothetical protein [Pyrinomonadaceae bacterium]